MVVVKVVLIVFEKVEKACDAFCLWEDGAGVGQWFDGGHFFYTLFGRTHTPL
ncbi:hypothetical protein D3C83_317420 [compost metagenome]